MRNLIHVTDRARCGRHEGKFYKFESRRIAARTALPSFAGACANLFGRRISLALIATHPSQRWSVAYTRAADLSPTYVGQTLTPCRHPSRAEAARASPRRCLPASTMATLRVVSVHRLWTTPLWSPSSQPKWCDTMGRTPCRIFANRRRLRLPSVMTFR